MGDLFLSWAFPSVDGNEGYFVSGMVAFGLAHIFYASAFDSGTRWKEFDRFLTLTLTLNILVTQLIE